MSSILLFGFLLGMRHAVESDHIAAVASLAGRTSSLRDALLQGACWGAGHTITLFVACSAILLFDRLIPERLADGLEAAVGLMLTALGVDLLVRLRRERTRQRSIDGSGPRPLADRHERPAAAAPGRDFPLRALCVGMVHGLAGSAALILLTLDAAGSPIASLTFIGLFGIGSIAGMTAFSALIAVPLRWSAASAGWLHDRLVGTIGVVTIVLGGLLVYDNLARV